MVRRRRTAKSSASGHRAPRPFNKKDNSLARWETAADIPEDDVDRFHTSRDKILLEGENVASDDEGDEEEVFALKGMSEDESDEDDDEGEEGEGGYEEMDEDEPGPMERKKPATKSKGKTKKPSPPSSEAGESESEEEGWGKKKSDYYSSNAAQLDSDDEEANEMEEQEAKKLQAKAREGLTDDDFGLGDAMQVDIQPEEDIDEPPLVVLDLPQDKASILRHLEKTNPEALALARDWDDIAQDLTTTQAKIEEIEATTVDVPGMGLIYLHYQALLTYATTLAFYLHLRSTEKYAARPELLRSHPIMSRLLTLKQSLSTLEDLGFNISDSEGESDGDDEDEDALSLWSMDRLDGMDPDELKELMEEAKEIINGELGKRGARGTQAPITQAKVKAKATGETEGKPKKKKSKVVEESPETVQEEPPKKKRKTSSVPLAVPVPVFDLVEPTYPSSTTTSKKSSKSTTKSAAATGGDATAADPYGELTALQAADAQDKAARKKSLRFHTSKIESASARREKARAALGGDDDIPWKERRKEREKKVAESKRGMGGDDLDDLPFGQGEEGEEGGESEKKRGKRRKRDEDEESEGSDEESPEGYYELVKRKSKENKEKKKAEYDAQVAAQRAIEDEEADGPRALTHAILKNKGLTPRRNKSVRNPRVKKRQKFEKAKKKVASQKAVYRGGLAESRGKYEGEKSGISKVIKGVKL